MDAILNINSNAACYNDVTLSNNPKRRFFDWTRNMNGVLVSNPRGTSHVVLPGENRSIFNGARSVTMDSTTALSVESKGNSVYRFSWTGGSAPGWRTQRSLVFGGEFSLRLTVNNNATLSMEPTAGYMFSNVQVGDTIYIPVDNPGPFNPANVGFWVVLSASPAKLVLARPVGQSFNGGAQVTDTFVSTETGPLLAFSSAGVQTGDVAEVAAGFEAPLLKNYTIETVTCNWFEVASVSPLPEQPTNIASPLITFYDNAKRFVRIEADQEAALYINGQISGVRITPVVAGDPANTGWFENFGTVWSLSVLNRSEYPLNINVFSVE